MRRCLIALCAGAGLSLLAAAQAEGAITVTKTVGTGTVSGVSLTSVTTGTRVKFTATATGSITVVVEADTVAELDAVDVEVNKGSSSAVGQVQLIIRAKPATAGKITRVGAVRQISLDSVTDGELIIESITTDLGAPGGGNIGARGSLRGGEITAPIISVLNCAGNLTANVTASGRPGGGQSNINFVNVDNGGSLFGDLYAPQGSIGSVVITGNIGAPGLGQQPAVISRDGLRKLSANNIHGSIVSNENAVNSAANLQYLRALGNFSGTLQAHSLTILDTAQTERGIFIGGNMTGTMAFTGFLIQPLTIVGTLSGSVECSGVATDRPPTDPTRDTDVTLGGFSIGGRIVSRGHYGGPTTIAGPLDGEITIGQMGAPAGLYADITAPGMSGTLRIHGDFIAGRTLNLTGPLMPTGVIHVGEDFAGSIRIPALGLLGQVLIGADNPSPPAQWTGSVTVGATAINSGDYAADDAVLGGGTLASAPYRLNQTACSPAHASATPVLTSAFYAGALAPIVISSYGPMEMAPLVTSWLGAVRIQREITPGSCMWQDAEEAFNVYMVDPVDARLLIIEPSGAGLPGVGRYRVIPTGIVCRGVPGSPAVVWPGSCDAQAPNGAYEFTVGMDCDADGVLDAPNGPGAALANQKLIPDSDGDGKADLCDVTAPAPCPCDFNGDRLVTASDIFIFLDAWFAQNGLTGPGYSADFDGSNSVNASDIFVFLDSWFVSIGGCP